MIKCCCLLSGLPELLGKLLPDLNILARISGPWVTHHVLVVLGLLSQCQLAWREVPSLGHDIANCPGKDLPSLGAFVGVFLEQVGIWLEVRHNVDFALKTHPTQVHNNKRREIHHIICGAEAVHRIIQENWCYSLLTKEGSSPELE